MELKDVKEGLHLLDFMRIKVSSSEIQRSLLSLFCKIIKAHNISNLISLHHITHVYQLLYQNFEMEPGFVSDKFFTIFIKYSFYHVDFRYANIFCFCH